MASARLLHLLHNPPLADPPDAGTQISATGTPTAGIWTTRLLDPAAPPIAAAQVVETISPGGLGTGTYHFVHGRWLTRPLAAQTIGAGNWSFYAAQRISDGGENWVNTLWGLCVAQWRPGTGIIARALDTPNGGTGAGSGSGPNDRAALTTVAGGSLTLALGDCLILEVWSQVAYVSGASLQLNHALLYGGLGQYAADTYTYQSLTDTDAYLYCPQSVAFS